MVLKSLQDLPVTPDMVLKEAENKLFEAFERKRIRTGWQLRRFVAGIPDALGRALKKSETYRVVESILSGSWLPGGSAKAWS